MFEHILHSLHSQLHMWVVFLILIVTLIGYISNKISIENVSVIAFAVLLLFFHFVPLENSAGKVLVNANKLLEGFANPALVAVLLLLIVGQAIIQSGILNEVANIIIKVSYNNKLIAIFLTFLIALLVSGFLNNTPVVVIFIPIMGAIAGQMKISVSKVMMPLSYVAIGGGMLTVIGSSTNLLISGIVKELTGSPLGFFDFVIPGGIMASVIFLYVIFALPYLLPNYKTNIEYDEKNPTNEDDRQFITELDITSDCKLIGKSIIDGYIDGIKDVKVRTIFRGDNAYIPPFQEKMHISKNDVLIVSSTRKNLQNILKQNPGVLFANIQNTNNVDKIKDIPQDLSVAEVIINSNSNMIGRSLAQIGFFHKYNCFVVGIKRSSKMIRTRLTEVKLSAGDVLLMMGRMSDITGLRAQNDLLLMEWSTEELHVSSSAFKVGVIFVTSITAAAVDLMPIVIAAFLAFTLLILLNCISFKQAMQSLDGKIVIMVATSLALGTALQETGGAAFIAELILNLLQDKGELWIASGFFLCIAILTNVLSNNACAVLFTPIVVNTALKMHVDPYLFVIAVVFSASSAFASPIGYQTNLLVMGPGHYKFNDFFKAGMPLIILLWASFTTYCYFYLK